MRQALAIIALSILLTALAVFSLSGRFKAWRSQSVRVAAIQCFSEMGQTSENIERIVGLVEDAARRGAKIVVTPECAVQGYCYPPTWTSWTSGKAAAEDEMPVDQYAESITGPSITRLAKLADELDIYLCVGFVEKDGGKYFNSQALINPEGKIVGHHRKKAFWPPGDGGWCSEGDRPVQVVQTGYGKLGMMICRDYQILTKSLHDAGADIILYSVGWYGPNEENWFTNVFPERSVIPYKHHVISANWCGRYADDDWPGRGYSCIIDRAGKVLAISREPLKECVVIADIEIVN